jgi:5-hydroxyisourate hydrolase-like protein (transthyretin family)
VSGSLTLGEGRRRLLRIGLASVAVAGTARAPGVAAQPAAQTGAQTGGSLEVHALDATIGKPAEGIVVDLFLVSTEPARKVGQVTTNTGGQATLLAGSPLKVGRYELRVAVGDYFRRRGLALAPQPFLEVIPIRIYLGNPQGHYHVPVVFTPWGYTMHG